MTTFRPLVPSVDEQEWRIFFVSLESYKLILEPFGVLIRVGVLDYRGNCPARCVIPAWEDTGDF